MAFSREAAEDVHLLRAGDRHTSLGLVTSRSDSMTAEIAGIRRAKDPKEPYRPHSLRGFLDRLVVSRRTMLE